VKLNDAVTGALLAALGAGVLLHVQRFPRIPGQNVGPALFPGLIAAGLCVCGLLLIVRGWRARAAGGEGAAWLQWPAWVHAPPQRRAFIVLIGVNVFYLLAVQWLGFVLTGVVYLAALFAAFGVRRAWILPLAVLLTLVVHAGFAKLLRVPLPWGVLQPIAW
jgi:putative tricarboxylic transport membrane protein